jgi:penicillin-binding protein 2
MSVIHAPRKPRLDWRILTFPVLAGSAMLVLFLRLWYFQVLEGPVLTERAEASRVVPLVSPAPRGLIYDRTGSEIATVRSQVVVTEVQNTVKNNPWVLDRLSKILDVPVEKLERKSADATRRPFVPSPIYVGANIKDGVRIAESSQDLPGIGVETAPMRFYPDTRSFSHVLGYVWVPSAEQAQKYAKEHEPVPDYVGKTGIELAYDEDLEGEPGTERIAIDAKRHPLRVEGRDVAVPGNRLVLTLSKELQQFTTNLFEEKGFVGGAVAIDPRNGEVLCLVSSPTFDQNIFKGGISDEEWRQFANDPQKPQENRAISGAYAPGSTFKLVTTVAAARTGVFNPNVSYFCPGGFFRGKVHLKCLGHHGSIRFANALAKSCNTYFCNLGVAAGEDAIRKAAVDMGLGLRPGIEIGGGGSAGVVPTLKWLRKVSHKKNPPWYLGDTANLSVGQGYMATTPLQMANVMALVANNGTSYTPHLVRKVLTPDGKGIVRVIEPTVAHKVDLPSSFWEELKDALVGVVDHGTGGNAKIPNLTWGGKTGSAEHQKETLTHSWFVGFAPADNPQIAVCVLVESAGHGGDIAAPVAGEIVRHYLIPPKKVVLASSAAVAVGKSPLARANSASR